MNNPYNWPNSAAFEHCNHRLLMKLWALPYLMGIIHVPYSNQQTQLIWTDSYNLILARRAVCVVDATNEFLDWNKSNDMLNREGSTVEFTDEMKRRTITLHEVRCFLKPSTDTDTSVCISIQSMYLGDSLSTFVLDRDCSERAFISWPKEFSTRKTFQYSASFACCLHWPYILWSWIKGEPLHNSWKASAWVKKRALLFMWQKRSKSTIE